MACILVVSIISILSFFPAYSLEIESMPLKTYIVRVRLPVDHNSSQVEDIESFYHSFLPKTATGLNDLSRMVFSYRNIFTGFAARLSTEEVKEIEKKEGILYARPEEIYHLHTTRTPRFLGLYRNHGFWPRSKLGKGVIIGMLDDGIKADHPSFSDKDMPCPPPKWKGRCDLNGTSCNKKLIGARNFLPNITGLPVDPNDHGTHTSSTAAGNFVEEANVFGNANGTAAGLAPLAHLAMYQVCGFILCNESGVAAAFDAAFDESVDMLSLSLGTASRPFYADSIAIGAFRAIQKGIFVSCSAGNDGPYEGYVSNEAPWILTVGASSIERNIRATAVLGNNDYFDGESLFQPKDFSPTFLPLVFPGINGVERTAKCWDGSLDGIDVKGKVVLCEADNETEGTDKGEVVKDAGGVAMVLINQKDDGYTILAEAHVLPATAVSFNDGQAIKAYINSTSAPTAMIVFKGTILGVRNTPAVASFSSRGPSKASPGILKPDIIGPGLNILGAWPYSVENITNATSTFHVISGTSMSCPHLTGVAALLKSVHRKWSPAAIKSAIITTAEYLNHDGGPILDEKLLPANVLAIGSGHVNPSRAADPGLVYDIQPDDYIPYLCGLGYTDENVEDIVGRPVKCATVKSIPEAQLNYPSFSIQLGSAAQSYTRIVTNVGKARSTYSSVINGPRGVDVIVEPRTLEFTKKNQKLSYEIRFVKSDKPTKATYAEGSITWVSKEYNVRSPISVKFV